MGPLQRYPVAFTQLFGLYGMSPPQVLEDSVRATVDFLQLYSRTQFQRKVATNGTLAEAGSVGIVVPANEYWLLIGAAGNVLKTATMTALSINLRIGVDGLEVPCATEEFSQFGATVTGSAQVAFWPGAPVLLLPGWSIRLGIDILGTDANASAAVSANVGVLT